jgi:hypothetical protein
MYEPNMEPKHPARGGIGKMPRGRGTGSGMRKLSLFLITIVTSARPSAAGWAACLNQSVSFVAVPRILAFRSVVW